MGSYEGIIAHSLVGSDTGRVIAPIDFASYVGDLSADPTGAGMLIAITLPPYSSGDVPHQHLHTAEILYVILGTIACTIGDMTTTASPGTVIVISPGTNHSVWNPTAGQAVYLAWVPAEG